MIAVEAERYTGRYMRDVKVGGMMSEQEADSSRAHENKMDRPTIMTPPTNVRYHIRSAFFENLALVLSSWLRYVYTIESFD